MDFSPSFATPPFLTPAGTVLSTITITTSDGSPFTGTLSYSGSAEMTLSGMNIVNVNSHIAGGGQTCSLEATQNGCTCGGYFSMNAM
jgi:hypothetical protein